MRKYEKPKLYYESFELSMNIASCAQNVGSSEFSCTVDLGYGFALFVNSNAACTYFDWDENNKVCYNVPFASGAVFSS